MDKASASYTGGQVGLERATIEPKIAGSSPVGGVLFFLFFFFFHPRIKNATYSFLSRSGTLKKNFNSISKKKKKNVK